MPARRKEQDRRVGVADEDAADEILFLRRHASTALAAAPLRAIGRQRNALDIAAMRDGDDHVLVLDQVLDVVLELLLDDLGLARRGELVADLGELRTHDLDHAFARAEDVEIVADRRGERVQLLGDLAAFEPGQALQPQIEDGARLLVGQPVRALADWMLGIVEQRDKVRNGLGRPVARQQARPRLCRVLGGADQGDHLVDVRDGNGEPDQHMGTLARLAQLVDGAPADHLLAEGDERFEHRLQRQHFRPAADQRQRVDAEARLQGRVAVELVEHDLRHRVAADLDHHAHAVAVGLVAKVGDALDALLAHQLGDPLDHPRLVHLVRHLGDDDRLAVLADLLDMGAAAHDHRAAPGVIGGADADAAEDQAAGRKVRSRQDLHQLVDAHPRLVEQRDAGVDHLAQIVGRDVGRHADRNAARPVDQQVRELRRQDRRLLGRLVVVGDEIDRLLVDVVEQRMGGMGEPRLGVAHGRRRVAIHRPVIALAVDQGQAHGEVLRHAHHGVVDRGVAVRVILAHHVADDAGRLAVGAVPVHPFLVHREQDPAMHRLQPVAHVGQCAAHDHAHGVIEVGAAHLLLDRHGRDIERLGLGRVRHGIL